MKQKPNNEIHPQEITLEDVNFKPYLGLTRGKLGGGLKKIKLIYCSIYLRIVPQEVICAVGIAALLNVPLVPHFLAKACSEGVGEAATCQMFFGTHLWDVRSCGQYLWWFLYFSVPPRASLLVCSTGVLAIPRRASGGP